ncbi:signal peptide peptidase SppA [Candidatus Woesearchaeota archaeon]|jgi:protease IV|nr:signal peptide peptidase SppA [Candidatus Woesearchaeota archaeon]MBT4368109.1 signal peptide peptidase SppA [Candidatus Woesearchaeota archaeon]MBT4712597.1 signal peptide peptidase SppA [Candidatus Woesearchaeota archaeon]MBT6639510.1 signal peptide peptidase SppA [Candidatus Woesearchaeota archaeon]MBT7133682.1 signal peptide peptidase SppA [Candidatus Woesearchaeota archaeon]
MKRRKLPVWVIILLVLIILSVIGYMMPEHSGNIALIKVEGVITTQGMSSIFMDSPSSVSIVEKIQSAEDDRRIKAIILEINSPGGSPVGSKEIVDTIIKTEKPVIAYVRDVGASGGYWVASAADTILASELSLVGSVGVNGAYLEFSGLLDEYNISYVPLTSGKYKDIKSPFKNLGMEEEIRLREKLDLMHEYFINSVKENRGLTEEQVNEIKEADIYLGLQAKDLGLIDEFGGREEAVKLIEEKLELNAEIELFEDEVSLLSLFSKIVAEQSFNFGKGMSSNLFQNEGLMLK